MKRLLLPLSVLVLAGLLWASVTPAYACSCPATIERNIARANIIAVANLGEVRFDPPLTTPYSENRQTLVDLRVERYLKGSGPQSLTVADPAYTVIEAENGVAKSGGISCTIFADRPVGRRYVLFLDASDPPASAPFCGGSAELDNPGAPATVYLATIEAILGAEALPSGGGPPMSSSPGRESPVAFVGSLVIVGPLVFLAGAAFLWRRGSSRNGLAGNG